MLTPPILTFLLVSTESNRFCSYLQRWSVVPVVRLKTFVAVVLVTVGLGAQARTIEGRIVGVTDGDTVSVLDASNTLHKIRLAGIDAPEKAQAFGDRSKQSLSDLSFNRLVIVETTKRDRYGRSLGKVFIDGRDVNLLQLERGMAWFYRAYQSEQSVEDRTRYADAERKAKEGRKGLWTDAAPTPPWDYRRNKLR